jgi:hypothetical protein
VRREETVQRRRGDGVELVDGVRLRRLELEAQPLRPLGIANEEPVVVSRGPLPDPRAVLLVAATAALLAQKYPNESPAMWKYRIESSAQRPLGDTKDAALGWGVLSPYDALTMTLDPNRPGPAMPGHAAPPKKVEREAVGAVELEGDPNATNRQIGIWMAFLTVVGVGGLRLVRVLRRGPDRSGPGLHGIHEGGVHE